MYCPGECPMGEYRMVSHPTAFHRRVLYRSPACHPVHRKVPCRSSPFLREVCLRAECRSPGALQDVYLRGPRMTRMRLKMPERACPAPARMRQASMRQIVWKYFRNLMYSRRQKFPQ